MDSPVRSRYQEMVPERARRTYYGSSLHRPRRIWNPSGSHQPSGLGGLSERRKGQEGRRQAHHHRVRGIRSTAKKPTRTGRPLTSRAHARKRVELAADHEDPRRHHEEGIQSSAKRRGETTPVDQSATQFQKLGLKKTTEKGRPVIAPIRTSLRWS